jgi:hypothetical protein
VIEPRFISPGEIMYCVCYRLGFCALAILTAISPVHAADKVLVPGNPPLTQQQVDTHTQCFCYQWKMVTRARPTLV